MDIVQSFFDTQGFMPHGMCILWQADILYTRATAGLLTAIAYFATAAGVVRFLSLRQDIPYRPFFVLYGSLIFIACGSSHLMGIWTHWFPDYGIETVIMVITAVTSIVAAIWLWPLIPKLVALPSPALLAEKNLALEREVISRRDAEARVHELNSQLEAQVQERTQQLADTNQLLQQKLEELNQAHALLEDRVAERTKELKESLIALETAHERLVESEKMAALGGLVSGVAHELNTPLGICVTSTSFIQEQLEDMQVKLKEKALTHSALEDFFLHSNEAISLVLNSLRTADQQVRLFKKLAVSQWSESRESIDIKQFIEIQLDNVSDMLEYMNVQLNCPQSLMINIDTNALSQVLKSLLSNTVSHGYDTTERGNIEISVTSGQQKIYLCYQDRGKGMDEDQVKHVFDPFFTTRRGIKGGPGLGMSITYNLVTQRLGGEIECHSTLQQGVKFIITLNTEE